MMQRYASKRLSKKERRVDAGFIKKLVLPAIRDFKRLRFLMTDKTVRKSVRTKTGDHSSVP